MYVAKQVRFEERCCKSLSTG